MEGEQHAVTGQLHVGLEVPISEGDGCLEGGEGVLGSFAATTAMGKRNRGRSFEKGTLHHGRSGQRSRTTP